jgi:hypothetical protein
MKAMCFYLKNRTTQDYFSLLGEVSETMDALTFFNRDDALLRSIQEQNPGVYEIECEELEI